MHIFVSLQEEAEISYPRSSKGEESKVEHLHRYEKLKYCSDVSQEESLSQKACTLTSVVKVIRSLRIKMFTGTTGGGGRDKNRTKTEEVESSQSMKKILKVKVDAGVEYTLIWM